MNWEPMLSGWQWGVIAAVTIGLVLLYMLKLRRQPHVVSSTLLWRSALQELHANHFWQRMRWQKLLLLQLGVLALMSLALFGPNWQSSTTRGRQLILVIDHSASMSGSDREPSRLADAQRQAERLVASLLPGDEALVLAFSDRAQLLQGFTDDTVRLRAAIRSIEPTARAGDPSEAWQLVASWLNKVPASRTPEARPEMLAADTSPALGVTPSGSDAPERSGPAAAENATVYLFSDCNWSGGTPPPSDLGAPIVVPTVGGEDPSNAAIVGLRLDALPADRQRWEALVQVANYAPRPQSIEVNLTRGEELIDAGRVQLDAAGLGTLRFTVDGGPQVIKAEIVTDRLQQPDHLAWDNVAYAAIPPHRPLKLLLVSPGNRPLEAALRTPMVASRARLTRLSPEALQSDLYSVTLQREAFDIIIFDGCQPLETPSANCLYLGGLPPGGDWSIERQGSPIEIVDVDRRHPIVSLVEMRGVAVLEGHSLRLPAGAETLMRCDLGPLLGLARRGPYYDAVLGFGISSALNTDRPNTDWPLHRSFPVFMLSTIDFLGGGSGTESARSWRPGQVVRLPVGRPESRLQVEMPDGQMQWIDSGSDGVFRFVETDQLGMYRLRDPQSGEEVDRFVVNLFQPAESRLQPSAPPDWADIVANAADAGATAGRWPAWPVILVACLGLISFEWYWYWRLVS
jgi:hypothetical protein